LTWLHLTAISARGMLIGLSRGTGRAQIARAALESIAYQVANVLEAMVSSWMSGRPRFV